MADYFTDFSCMFDVGTPDNARRALELYQAFGDQLEREDAASAGFALAIHPAEGGTALWIHSDESGDPEHVIAFVLLCAQTFQLKGRWGFEWANTCSKPHLDAFGGGAHIVDLATGSTFAWVSTNEWLTRNLAASRPERE
jgi:hypothetical protein